MVGYLNAVEGDEGHSEVHVGPAVHYGPYGHHLAARGPHRFDDLARRLSRRDDILDDQGALALFYSETPAAVPEEELVVETPEPLPPPEEPEPDPVVEEQRVREEEKPEPTPTPPPPRPEEEEAGDPEPDPEESGENLSVRMEGLRRDFPDYYLNIIRQINRCMRFNGPGGLKTTVYFVLKRDGSVDGSDIDFVNRSGNAGFDFAVMEAVECAGAGRFGTLPEELAWDRLPVVFEVTSSRRTPDPSPSLPRP